ncbi:hypothetical protein [Chryseobacterium sp. Tr-659]|nr:hypothetical protein [Chryseobacterium sp. Tr-659]
MIFKILTVIIALLGGAYAACMYCFVEESKNSKLKRDRLSGG